MKTYANDPRQIAAKFNSKCSKCKKVLLKGQQIFYWPSDKSVLCFDCGQDDYNAFLSSKQDEAFYNGEFY
ncbi:MAG: hypothetical protein PHT69_04210 [Bacteroidales bacterium]|nr:hypothetical protein [Bacteroidales bacterium]